MGCRSNSYGSHPNKKRKASKKEYLQKRIKGSCWYEVPYRAMRKGARRKKLRRKVVTTLFTRLRDAKEGILAETNQEVMHLWRAQGDFDDEVLNTFSDSRVSKGQEIWIKDSKTVDFALFEAEKEKIANFLRKHGVNYTVLVDNVREKLDEALVQTFPTKRNAVSGDSFTWAGYPNLREINSYLEKIAKNYASHCSLVSIGKTHHGKPIYMLQISNGRQYNRPMLVNGGTHGREWTSVITVLYFIDNIVRNYSKQPAYITKINWHIIPVLNPDGYEYSLSSDRVWKKNRRRLSVRCYGVDLNRNFDYKFDNADEDICSPSYCGPVPFSEEETKAFKNITERHYFYGYLSVHSGGTKVLFPKGATPYEHNKHLAMTKQIALAMRKIDNVQFVNGNMLKMGKKSYGMAFEWMYFVKKIPHSYVIETRGQNGLDFIKPKDILLAAKEVNAGLLKFAEEIK